MSSSVRGDGTWSDEAEWAAPGDVEGIDAEPDVALEQSVLAVVGRPTAVNPDMRLRSLARAYNWPILDLK